MQEIKNQVDNYNFIKNNLNSMVSVNVINNSENQLPKYETDEAAGLDLRASFKYITPDNPIKLFGDGEIIFAGEGHQKTMLRLEPGSRAIIPTDLFVAIPKGYFCAIYPRSGLAIKKALSLVNSVGVLDSDYRGNMGIPVINHGFETIWIEDGERIAQMIVQPYTKIEWNEVKNLDETSRNSNGFGTTGSK
jgi:dUTP pyrophosphatase